MRVSYSSYLGALLACPPSPASTCHFDTGMPRARQATGCSGGARLGPAAGGGRGLGALLAQLAHALAPQLLCALLATLRSILILR